MQPDAYAHHVKVWQGVRHWCVTHSWRFKGRYGAERQIFVSKNFASQVKAEKYAESLRAGLDKHNK